MSLLQPYNEPTAHQSGDSGGGRGGGGGSHFCTKGEHLFILRGPGMQEDVKHVKCMTRGSPRNCKIQGYVAAGRLMYVTSHVAFSLWDAPSPLDYLVIG